MRYQVKIVKGGNFKNSLKFSNILLKVEILKFVANLN